MLCEAGPAYAEGVRDEEQAAAVRIGNVALREPFCQAGLAGYSDRAMRVVARRRGCGYAVTEALLDTILLNGGKGLANSIDIDDEDHPVAGQVIGSDADTVSRAGAILHGHGYDVVDLNFACPVKKIKSKSRGGHMLRDVERGVEILRAVRETLPHAVLTASLRCAYDEQDAKLEALGLLLGEMWQQGYAAARVHARTVAQKYAGRADWSVLRTLKREHARQTLIGSGDVFTPGDAVAMLLQTGVDMVWIARGAIGNPWIFEQSARLLRRANGVGSEGDARVGDLVNDFESHLAPPGVRDQREALREHFELAMSIHGEELAGRRMRKMGIKYARFHPDARGVKDAFVNVRSLGDWTGVLERHYADDRPGIWPASRAADEVNEEEAGGCA
jgi:tRNA-dihydrouridine synthase